MYRQDSLFPEFEQPSRNTRHSSRASSRQLQPPTPMPIDLVQLRNEIRALIAPQQKQIDYLASRLDGMQADMQLSYAQINQMLKAIQPYHYELVYDRPASVAVLEEALDTAQQKLILVCPWLTPKRINARVIQRLEYLIERDVSIKIGWGRLDDIMQGKTDDPFWYGALPSLRQLQYNYPEHFELKALGTHEKYLVCDDFALLGSHNFLTSGISSTEREVGLRTTDPRIVQGLIHRFESAQNLEGWNLYRGGRDWQYSAF